MNLRLDNKIKIGSGAFFSEFLDYKSHDIDYIVFIDKNTVMLGDFFNIRIDGSDIFVYKFYNKEKFITSELEKCILNPMAAGKFLIPKVMEYLNLTIDELKQFEFAFERIDTRHLYEKYIYECYIENNKPELTDIQLKQAYEIYKKYKILK